MAEAKVSLQDQIASVERALWEAGTLFRNGIYEQHPHMADFERRNIEAAIRTLRFMQTHEQTIRNAISSARPVDDTQDTR